MKQMVNFYRQRGFFLEVLGSIGAGLIGGLFDRKAAKQQVQGNERAIAAQRELVQPFVDFGTAGLNPLAEFVGQGANFADTQAFKDIVNTQKARGQNLSGNTLTELATFNAVNFRPQRFNELFKIASLGANAAVGQATNIGQLEQNIGTAKARGTSNVGSAIGTGIQDSFSFLDQFLSNRSRNVKPFDQEGLGGG